MKTILDILDDIEAELRHLELWSQQRPSDSDLASTQPFCIDTLNLPQWIQFVLLERLRMMIERNQSLPTQCGVEAIAEEYFKNSEIGGENLTKHLHKLDVHLSRLPN